MNVAICGLGLIGGSLGRTLVAKTDHTVFATDIDRVALKTGELIKAYHYELTNDNIKNIDILFVALYPKTAISVIKEYAPKLKKGAMIVDLCGNKRTICSALKEISKEYPDLDIISSHPMAGREFSGIKHSISSLFDRASMILIPVKADIRKLSAFKEFCLSIGFLSVVITTAEEHDRIISYTSQLAHIVSSAYIKSPTAENYLGFSAGSFRDMTRVARLSPEMWTELMADNRDNLVREIECMIENLKDYAKVLKENDEEKLYKLLEDGTNKKLLAQKLKNKKID